MSHTRTRRCLSTIKLLKSKLPKITWVCASSSNTRFPETWIPTAWLGWFTHKWLAALALRGNVQIEGINTELIHNTPSRSSAKLSNLAFWPFLSSKASIASPFGLNLMTMASGVPVVSQEIKSNRNGRLYKIRRRYQWLARKFCNLVTRLWSATQKSPSFVRRMLSGKPGTSANSSRVPSLGPFSQYFPILLSRTQQRMLWLWSSKERTLKSSQSIWYLGD